MASVAFTIWGDRPGHLCEAVRSKRTGNVSVRWQSVLAQNSRAHWRTRYECMQKDKHTVVLHARNKAPDKPWKRAKVSLVAYVTTNRRRDAQALEWFKGVLDGLVDAGILVDDSIEVIGSPSLQIRLAEDYGYSVEVEEV